MVQMETLDKVGARQHKIILHQVALIINLTMQQMLGIGNNKEGVALNMRRETMEEMGQVEQQEMAEQMAQAKMQILMLLPQMLPIKQLLIN